MSSDGLQWGWKSVNPKATSAPEAEAAETEEPQAYRTGTFIGSGALFEGTLSLKGDFRIDSEFRGELCTDGAIIIGPAGSVVGDVRAREVQVFGAVVGDVTARRQLVLHAGCRVHGDLETACLEIQRHAFFQGGTKMSEPQARREVSTERAQPGTPAAPPA